MHLPNNASASLDPDLGENFVPQTRKKLQSSCHCVQILGVYALCLGGPYSFKHLANILEDLTILWPWNQPQRQGQTHGTLPISLALAPSGMEAPLHLWAQLSKVTMSKPLRFSGFLLYKMRKQQKVRLMVTCLSIILSDSVNCQTYNK